MIISMLIYVFIAVFGFMVYRLMQPKLEYHGPVANDIIKYIYHDPTSDIYYKFNIKMFMCPPSLNGKCGAN